MRHFLIPILYAALSLAAPAALEKRAPDPTVTIASGVVVGTATKVANQPTVTGLANSYLGIPFAQSPPLRFAPPSAPKAWSSPLKAQTLPPSCLQQFNGEREKALFNNPGLPAPTESEDCMYLNVYAPRNASPSNLKPVMFWIYGGNLNLGTGSLAAYNGSSLAVNEDVVVVTFNYRMNIFGFSNSPEIPFGQQNAGFLDQRFALQWVQENIEEFGGDPAKVTLFGESAGGYSVKQLLANPPSPLPFRAAIMESQQTFRSGNALTSYKNVSAHFNCSSAASPLACLRDVSGTDLKSYIVKQGLSFQPVSDDGTDVASRALPNILSGKFADVPILIGTNKNEGRVFGAILGDENQTSLIDNIFTTTGIGLSSIEPALLATYPAAVRNVSTLLLSQILTDILFTCPTQSLSQALQAMNRQPIWRYRFDASFPDVAPFPDAGAFHSVEIPQVFGTYPLSNALGNATNTQVALSKYMQGVWAGFAKDPTAGAPWPKLGSNHSVELGLLGASAVPAAHQTVPLATADQPCMLINLLLTPAGLSF